MATPKRSEYPVGQFECPDTHALVPLMSPQAFGFLHWPIIIEHCPSCGQTHKLEASDVEHPPVYGRE